ncbi:CPBP family intramembrane glutamic endopeptidase [uncultured Bacteroides sp.]|uniref:CPBP family intramembrane glutamic endopeptidase n=2 Tax=uncultured Bacteroides sp. TaxID=162156 RepID=UPI002610FE3D|nr:CPBP family intramembrane glutamic endopeptidase [uncultured Bacteroides sp.]
MNKNKAILSGRSKALFYILLAAKIIIYLSLMQGLAVMLYMVAASLLPDLSASPKLGKGLGELVVRGCFLAGAVLAALVLQRAGDHLPFSSLGLSPKERGRDLLQGMMYALLLYAVGFGVLYGLGEIEVVSVRFDAPGLLLSFLVMLLVALSEEIAFRGFVLGRLLAAGVNRFAALLLSAALFSLMHLFNPGFSLIAFLNILLAGMLLGSTYIYTRNLCFPIALHLFWNWLQGPVLGFGVSGGDFGDTLLTLHVSGNDLINGGAFGFEASVVCTALMLCAVAVSLRSASRRYASGRCRRSVP